MAQVFLSSEKMKAEDLQTISPKDMAIFLAYFLNWVEKTHRNLTIKPDGTLRNEMYISNYSDFDLVAVIRWIIREFLTLES